MKSKILLVILLCFMLVGAMGLVDAKKKTYDSLTQTVNLDSSFLGIKTGNIAEIKLNTPLNYEVGLGYQMVAEFTANFQKDYDNPFEKMDFYNVKNKMNKFTRDFDYKYLTYEDYPVDDYSYTSVNNQTIKTLIGTHQETREVWLPLTKKAFKQDEVLTIGIFTEVKIGDYVEWIPTFFGVEIDEWAFWTEGLSANLVSYYTLNETSGTTVFDSLGLINFTDFDGYLDQAGLIGRSVRKSATLGPARSYVSGPTFTKNVWIKRNGDYNGAIFSNLVTTNRKNLRNMGFTSNTAYDFTGDTGCVENYQQTGASFTASNDWNMFTMSCLNSVCKIFVNAINVQNITLSSPVGTCEVPSEYAIGEAYLTYFNNGLSDDYFDEYSVFNKSLNLAEVTRLYNEGDGMTYTTIYNFAPTITTNAPANNSNFTASNVTLNITASNTTTPIADVKLFINGELNNTNSSGLNGTYLWDLNFADGIHSWSVGVEDILNAVANSSLRNFTIDTVLPQIVIQSPNETFGYLKVNDTLDLNVTATDTNLDTCWYDYNSTNISFSCVTGVKSEEVITQNANNFSVIVYANDTSNNLNSTSVNWNYRVFENNLTYNDQVVETSNQDFNISVTHDSSIWNSITSKIEYNGTNYSATQFGTGDTLIFSRTLEIPAITTSTENKSFYWYFTLTNGTGAYDFRSSEYTQNVSEIDIHLCGTEETAYLRFFTNDSENPFPALNATFKSAWNIGSLGGSGLLANYSFEDLTEVNNTWEFCITPNETEYTLTVDVEVDATDFAKNFYYIQEEDYTDNSTTNITLYLLNDTAATPTILRTRNTAQNRLTNVLIYIDVFDVGTNDYYTVGMAKTNENGEDVVYLNWYETLYRFRLFQDGLNTLTTNNTKIFETPKIFEIGEDFTYSFDKFDNIIHTLVYDNATNIFTLIFDTNDASIESGCLRVIKRNPTNDTEICLTCVESESATINCDVSTYGNGTFIAAFYATGSFSLVDLLSIVEGSSFADQVFDMLDKDDAAFYSIILALIVVAMFLITPVLGIIGAIIGLIFVTSLGFATISYAYFMGIIILGVVIIWSLKK